MKKIYLAIPYSFDPDRSFEAANRVTAQLMLKGHVVFSPISHCHHLKAYLPKDLVNLWAWWATKDLPMVEWADEVHVVAIGANGYEYINNSEGVQAELAFARASNKPIKFIEHDEARVL